LSVRQVANQNVGCYANKQHITRSGKYAGRIFSKSGSSTGSFTENRSYAGTFAESVGSTGTFAEREI